MIPLSSAFGFNIVLIMLACATPAWADDWYRFRGPQLNGISRESIDPGSWPRADGQTPVARILWRQSVGTGMSGVVVFQARTSSGDR